MSPRVLMGLVVLAGLLIGGAVLFLRWGYRYDRRNLAQLNPPEPTHDQIAALAYEFYLQRLELGAAGDADEDWYSAEHLLRALRI